MPTLVRIEYWNEHDGVWYTGGGAIALIDPEKYINRLNANGKAIGRCLELADDLQPTGQIWGSLDGVSFGQDVSEEEMDRKLLISLWEKLDLKLDELMIQANQDLRQPLQDSARGFSEAIQVLMSEHYPTTDDVVRESVVRYKARQSNTPHESPGLGERPRRTGLSGALRSGGTVRTTPSKPVIKVKQAFTWGDNRETACAMINAGIFENLEIASSLNVPVEAVEQLIQEMQRS